MDNVWTPELLKDIQDKKETLQKAKEPKETSPPPPKKTMMRRAPTDYEKLKSKDINEGLPEDPPEATIIFYRRDYKYYLGFQAPSDYIIRYCTHTEKRVDRNAKLYVEPFESKEGHKVLARAFDTDNNPVSRTYQFLTY